jgi:hypothetical protein
MNIRAIILAAAIGMSGAAAAQTEQQTIENAHAFLVLTLPRTYTSHVACPNVTGGWCNTHRTSILSPPVPHGRCGTLLYVRHDFQNFDNEKVIYWDHVTSVDHADGGSNVAVTMTSGASAQRFYFEVASPDLAARVAFAMEFIRRSCDPTQGLGF